MYFKVSINKQKKNKGGKKPNRKKVRKVDRDIANTYRMWTPITESKRSFFVWKGRWEFSPKEMEIYSILKGMNLKFYREISFDMVKRFDFYIPLVDLVIEYDGKHHFSELGAINNDKFKEKILERLGVKFIRYNKTHKLEEQIKHDLIYHPVLLNQSKND